MNGRLAPPEAAGHTDRVNRIVVDGMNFIGSTPNGWWRNRDGAVRRLVDELRVYAESSGIRFVVVFDGRLPTGITEGVSAAVEVLSANRGGRNAADDRIVEFVEHDPAPWEITVVTSDRELGDRARRFGSQIMSVQGLKRVLEEHD